MENYTDLNTMTNGSAVLQLPIGAVAFVPFLLLELVAAIVSNAILLALVILACTKKLNNNINIYLFSLAIGGLIGAFNIFCLISLIVARNWVLGFAMCGINYLSMIIYHSTFISIYITISRDKLKGVKDLLHGRPTNKRAYLNTIAVWIIDIFILIGFFIWYGAFITNEETLAEHGSFICYGFTSRRANMSARFIITLIFLLSNWTVLFTINAATFVNFVRIMLELRKLKKLRLRYANKLSRDMKKVIQINGRDKPLYHTGEERTAKSLTLVFFIQFICGVISIGMVFIQVIRNFVLPSDTEDGTSFQIYFLVQLTVLFFPCVNPIFLIMSNKRLRKRVKELFKCTLNPETEDSPIHQVVHVSHRTNQIIPSSVCR